ncbi:anti-phage deoxyguanosine triphosphatase [Achromobacter sp. F4_2707]|uniref:anti-phage deoxyguanosine triphosphatase n=1 Tax=Achromobacter sp. F4_2707 TaxID=3114286 RepID=UPI0039C6C326
MLTSTGGDAWLARREAWQARAEDAREAGDIDYARVIHSASFRRLQGKTQILNLGDSDFYRTRLTHSLEVAQIASGLVKQVAKSHPQHLATAVLPDRSLIQAIACSHDLGHPPFGHGGEVALNYCMREHGGFEGNGQTLRLLSRLENFSENAGANLSRRALLGVLKYPAAYSKLYQPGLAPRLLDRHSFLRSIDVYASTPPKCYLDSEHDVVEWILQPLGARDKDAFISWQPREGKHGRTLHQSLDCSIMDAADDIAYGVHDLEDAIALRLVGSERFREQVPPSACEAFLNTLSQKYQGEAHDPYDAMVNGLFGDGSTRKRYISRLVNYFLMAARFDEKPEFEEPLLRYRLVLDSAARDFLGALKQFIMDEVIRSASVQQLEFKGQGMVVSVFEAFESEPERLLPSDILARFRRAEGSARVICDYVAGMTDMHLLKTYERLFAPRMGSIFDRL